MAFAGASKEPKNGEGVNSKELVFNVVHNFKKTVQAESNFALELVEGFTPVFNIKISFKDIDLNGIESAYETNTDLFPVRNFLLGMKKGLGKNDCAFTLACYNMARKLSFYLFIEKMLFQKLSKTLQKPEVCAKMVITGLDETPAVLETVPCVGSRAFEFNVPSGLDITKELFQTKGKCKINLTVDIKSSCILKNQPALKISSDLLSRKLYDLPESSKDVTIEAYGGAEIKAHKIVLMAESPVFLSMFGQDNEMIEAQVGRVLLKENSAEGVELFVKVFYGFELPLEITSDIALELFQLSHKYLVEELEESMMDLLTKKGIAWYTVDTILELYFYVKNNKDLEELRAHALTELSTLSKEELTASDYFKKLELKDALDLMLELWAWK